MSQTEVMQRSEGMHGTAVERATRPRVERWPQERPPDGVVPSGGSPSFAVRSHLAQLHASGLDGDALLRGLGRG